MVFTLLFASTPFQAEAGLFSFILGDDAYADTVVSNPILDQSSQTSGTMALLQANISSTSALQDKKKKEESKKSSETSAISSIDPNINMNIISDSAILPATGPMGVYDSQESDSSFSKDMSIYVVRQGDSVSVIAEMFEVTVSTILTANNMKKGDKLVPGDVLLILPISGVEHTVTKGQTLQSIAKLYKADSNEIVLYNNISEDAKLVAGDKLLIPDGVKAEENDKPIKDLNASIAKDKQYYEKHPIKNLAGYYVNPVPGYRKSQGLHDKNGIDFAIGKGTPIHAAAAGKVTLARTGYNGGFGNLVIISHPNGTETLYAHQSKIATSTGAQVSQGQIIGYVGSTGRSTGPHLHFEVHGARNPGVDGSWAN